MNTEQNVHIKLETIEFLCLQTGLEPVSTVKTVALHYATENQEEGRGKIPLLEPKRLSFYSLFIGCESHGSERI